MYWTSKGQLYKFTSDDVHGLIEPGVHAERTRLPAFLLFGHRWPIREGVRCRRFNASTGAYKLRESTQHALPHFGVGRRDHQRAPTPDDVAHDAAPLRRARRGRAERRDERGSAKRRAVRRIGRGRAPRRGSLLGSPPQPRAVVREQARGVATAPGGGGGRARASGDARERGAGAGEGRARGARDGTRRGEDRLRGVRGREARARPLPRAANAPVGPSFCACLQEDRASSPTLQKLSKTVSVSRVRSSETGSRARRGC